MNKCLTLCFVLFALSSQAGKIMCGNTAQIDENHQTGSLVYDGHTLPLSCDGDPEPAWMQCRVSLANTIFKVEFMATRFDGRYHMEISRTAGDPANEVHFPPISCDHAESL